MTLVPPYVGALEQVLAQKFRTDPVAPRRHDRHVPKDLEVIIETTMARDPAMRFANADELAANLRAFADGKPITVRRLGRTYYLRMVYRQNRVIVHVVAAALLLVVFLVVVAFRMVQAREQKAEASAREAATSAREANRSAQEAIRNRARGMLKWYPSEALVTLRDLPNDGLAHAGSRMIAIEAFASGVAADVFPLHVPVNSLSWSPRDDRIVIGSGSDARLRMVDVGARTITSTHTCEAHGYGIEHVAWSHAADRIACGSSQSIAVVNIVRPQNTPQWAVGRGVTQTVSPFFAWSPTGDVLATGRHESHTGLKELKTARLTDWNNTRVIRLYHFGPRHSVDLELPAKRWELYLEVAWSPDGRHIAVKSSRLPSSRVDGGKGPLVVREVQAASLGSPEEKPEACDLTPGLAWHPRDPFLACVNDGSINVRAFHPARLIGQKLEERFDLGDINAELSWYKAVSWSPNGSWIAGWNESNGHIDVFAVEKLLGQSDPVPVSEETGSDGALQVGITGSVRGLAWSRDSKWLATAGDGRTLLIWRVEPTTRILGRIRETAFVRPSRIEMAWCGTRELLINVPDFRVMRLLHMNDSGGIEPSHNKAAQSKRSAYAATCSEDGRQVAIFDSNADDLHIVDTSDGSSRRVANAEDIAVISWVSGFVVSGGINGVIVRWTPDGKQMMAGRHGTGAAGEELRVNAVDGANDGRVLSGGEDGTVRVWNSASDGAAGRIVARHQGGVHDAAWSPSGRWVASVGEDLAIRVTEPSGDSGRVLGMHEKSVWNVAWSPDESTLASAGEDGVRIWDVATGEGALVFEGMAKAVVWDPAHFGRLLFVTADSTLREWRDTVPRNPEDLRAWLDRITTARLRNGELTSFVDRPEP